MKRINGYKCDHCSEFSEDSEVIKKHELNCYFDPKHRKCNTCEHRTEGYPFGGFECDVNQENGFDYECGEKTNCPQWKELNFYLTSLA